MKTGKTYGRRQEVKRLIAKIRKELKQRTSSKDTSLENLTKISHLHTDLSIAERRLNNLMRGIPEYGDEQAIIPLKVKVDFYEQ